MRLTTRKLVLGQIAHARGLIARAQEDPTYTLPAIWHTVRHCHHVTVITECCCAK